MSNEIVNDGSLPSEESLMAASARKTTLSGQENFQQPNTGLAEATKRKKDEEVERLKKSLLEETNKRNKKTLTEENPSPNPVKFPSLPGVNKEHEPSGISWQPTTPLAMTALYNHASGGIGDLGATIVASKQQPEFGFALPGGTGTMFLLKTSKEGQLFYALPSKDSKAFANIALNPDGDKDQDDKDAMTKEVANTMIHPLPYNKPPASPLESKEEPKISMDLFEEIDKAIEAELTEGKINIDSIKNPAQKRLVAQLLAAAEELRSDGPVLQDDIKELPPMKKQQLTESKKVENKVPLGSLNELMSDVRKDNKNTEFTEEQETQLEKIEDEIYTLIAQSLLLKENSINIVAYNKCVNKYKKLLGID